MISYIVVAKHKKQILLQDTHGRFYLGIRLPTKGYKPRKKKLRKLLNKSTKNDTKSIKSRRKMTHK